MGISIPILKRHKHNVNHVAAAEKPEPLSEEGRGPDPGWVENTCAATGSKQHAGVLLNLKMLILNRF